MHRNLLADVSMSDSVSRINTAVDECLGRCLSSRSPDAVIAAFLAEAIARNELSTEEAKTVEDAVGRVLRDQSTGR